jgi:hypothetical protein
MFNNNQFNMILLIGINISLMRYPITPMIANPKAHELAILINSLLK